MSEFSERYYSLDLKKSADFGSAKEVYTLRCRQIVFGVNKQTKNYLLTPIRRDENINSPQWNSFKKLLQNESVLIYSYRSLKRFFVRDDFAEYIKQKRKKTIELSFLSQLFLPFLSTSDLQEFDRELNLILALDNTEEVIYPEQVLDKLVRLISGYDRNLRKDVASILSPIFPLIAEWLDNFRDNQSKLPEKIKDHFPEHFIEYDYENEHDFDMSDVKAVFSSTGPLANILENYERRPEQESMSTLVQRAIRNDEIFLAEAGTGTGKSLAYLIPAVLNISENKTRTAVATYTKTLQNQLFFNDLKLAAEVCGKKLSTALLKGRTNYLCILKLSMLKARARALLDSRDFIDLVKILIWESFTKSGDLTEINLNSKLIYDNSAAETGFCLRQNCQFYNRCYYFKARKKCNRANLIVLNQALFFTDNLFSGNLLEGADLMVFDEAHRLEKTATAHLGGTLDRFQLLLPINKLQPPKNEPQSVLHQIKLLIENITEMKLEDTDSVFRNLAKNADNARNAISDLFGSLKEYCIKKDLRAETFPIKTMFDNNSDLFKLIKNSLCDLKRNLKNLSDELTGLYESIRAFDFEQDDLIKIESMFSVVMDINEQNGLVAEIDDCNTEKNVFWMELDNRGINRLHFAPLHVGEDLNNMIYERYSSVVLTSASLSIEGFFDFYENRIGVNLQPPERVIRKSFGSSFDFNSQIDFYCPVYLPNPNSEYYPESLARFIKDIVPVINKKSLILFTSYQLLKNTYELTLADLRSSGFEVLAQSISGDAHQVLESFKKSRLAVIFGTDSFWEGIDLPGKQLELLLITRLPFAVPSDPIEYTRGEVLKARGEDSFALYTLPNAILKFKQGFGRLIRQRSDSGIVILSDNRLVKSKYGNMFLNSIPATLNITYDQNEMLDKLNK